MRQSQTLKDRAILLLIQKHLGCWPEIYDELARKRGVIPKPVLTDKVATLIHDAGFGDSIMMCRYAPLLQSMGVQVVFRVPRELRRLLSQLAPIGEGEIDLPLTSVQRKIPLAPPLPPYLRADPVLIAHWQSRLEPSPGRRIGIAWTAGHDDGRCMPIYALIKRLPANAQLISLQMQETDVAGRYGVMCPAFADFADVAAVIALCDEVISVDTACVNLAGAMGAPTSVVLPHSYDRRWRFRAWYPDVKHLFISKSV
jgi:hypothetical protein